MCCVPRAEVLRRNQGVRSGHAVSDSVRSKRTLGVRVRVRLHTAEWGVVQGRLLCEVCSRRGTGDRRDEGVCRLLFRDLWRNVHSVAWTGTFSDAPACNLPVVAAAMHQRQLALCAPAPCSEMTNHRALIATRGLGRE